MYTVTVEVLQGLWVDLSGGSPGFIEGLAQGGLLKCRVDTEPLDCKHCRVHENVGKLL